MRIVTPGRGRPAGRGGAAGACRPRESVAPEDGEAGAAEEVAEPVAERRSARDRPAGLPAEGSAQLGIDQLAEDGVLGLGAGAGPTVVERLAVGDGRVGRGVEDLALARRLGLLLRRVVDL